MLSDEMQGEKDDSSFIDDSLIDSDFMPDSVSESESEDYLL